MEYQEVDEFLSKRPKLHMDGPTIVDEDISSIEVADNIPKEVGLTVENIDGDIFLKQENSLEKVDSVWLDDTEYGQKNVSNDIDHNESKDELNENEIVELLRKSLKNDIRHLSFGEILEKYSIEFLPYIMKALNVCPIPEFIDEMLIELKNIIDKQKRKKRQDINTLEQAVNLISKSKNIIVLTGAGVSVSCGIPDFRSKNGVYSRLDEFELEDPQQMFDIEYFRYKPETFYTFAKEIYPTNFKPSPSHAFIKLLETKGKLLRNYTQNIDTLEQIAGIKRIIQCHGSFAMAKCIECDYRVDCKEIEEDIFAKRVPLCPKCYEEKNGIIKPEITFFGEKLPKAFDDAIAEDSQKVDLLIVIGSSLKVSPVADVKDIIPHDVPQILINMESLPHMQGFDIHLLGYCDVVTAELCRMLKWDLVHDKIAGGNTLAELPEVFFEETIGEDGQPRRVRKLFYKKSSDEPHKYFFEGALGLEDMHPNSYIPSGQEDSSGSSESDSSDDSTEDDSSDDESSVKSTNRHENAVNTI